MLHNNTTVFMISKVFVFLSQVLHQITGDCSIRWWVIHTLFGFDLRSGINSVLESSK